MRNPNRLFKDAIYEQFARIGKAVSCPKRLELLDLLCQGERSVESLAAESSMTIANTSRHLQSLRAARLVEGEKRGLFVFYRPADPGVWEFFLCLRKLAENRLAEVNQILRNFLEDRQAFEPVDRRTLLDRVRKGNVTVLDVRPAEEYCAGHIPGAVSVPLRELEDRMAELPKGRQIVAYCRGPYCVLAVEAVRRLRTKGYRAVRLDMGVVDWRALGLPVEAGTAGGT